ncbi:YciI family protein [Nocardioides hankookensis]|uniref:YciI family protein n=1 Tax=Nocardioides hankookensis TaxID=443157 RepID=A0ABW1LQZ0_9ACTN
MRYMVFVKMAPDVGEAPPALFEAMDAEMGRAFADGSIITGGGLGGGEQIVELRLAAGAITTTDGPYAEAKEIVGGFSIVEARSQYEAVEGARRVLELHQQFWPGWDGAVEIRPIWGGPPETPAG